MKNIQQWEYVQSSGRDDQATATVASVNVHVGLQKAYANGIQAEQRLAREEAAPRFRLTLASASTGVLFWEQNTWSEIWHQ